MTKTIYYTSPRSFLLYIVADTASAGETRICRHLAVAYHKRIGPSRHASNPMASDHQHVRHLIEHCARIVAMLNEPTNQPALEAQVELSRACHMDLEGAAVRQTATTNHPEASYFQQLAFDLSISRDARSRPPDLPELPCSESMREYPSRPLAREY